MTTAKEIMSTDFPRWTEIADVLDGPEQECYPVDKEDPAIAAWRKRREKYLDPIQNNCHYGYVLPDRCRYMRHKGCPCGAYPGDKDGRDISTVRSPSLPSEYS